MSKFTYKEIKTLIKCTPAELKGKQINTTNAEYVGYYKHAAANWVYRVHAVIVSDQPRPVLCVEIFGEIK